MLKRWYKFNVYGQEKKDIAPNGKTLELEESNANLDEVVALAKELQYEHWRENFFNELEIFFADVLHIDVKSGVTLKIKGM